MPGIVQHGSLPHYQGEVADKTLHLTVLRKEHRVWTEIHLYGVVSHCQMVVKPDFVTYSLGTKTRLTFTEKS